MNLERDFNLAQTKATQSLDVLHAANIDGPAPADEYKQNSVRRAFQRAQSACFRKEPRIRLKQDKVPSSTKKKSAIKPSVRLPFFGCAVSCGFPSPADDYIEKKLDLNEYLIDKPSATFFVRVAGDSMIGVGIHPDDLLIVDRSKEPRNKSIVLAIVNGEFTVKRYICRNSKITLKAENPAYQDIVIVEGMQFEVVGVCTNVIHSLK